MIGSFVLFGKGNFMYASNRPTLGRRMLMTDEREITKDNIIQVVSKAFMEHQENVAEEVYLLSMREEISQFSTVKRKSDRTSMPQS